MNHENSPEQIQFGPPLMTFALGHSEVRTKPYIYFHKTAHITSHAVC